MSNTQPCLKPLLYHEPVRRTLIPGKRPFVETSGHQGFVAAEIHQRSNPERCDQLTSSDRFRIWHKTAPFKTLKSTVSSIPFR